MVPGLLKFSAHPPQPQMSQKSHLHTLYHMEVSRSKLCCALQKLFCRCILPVTFNHLVPDLKSDILSMEPSLNLLYPSAPIIGEVQDPQVSASDILEATDGYHRIWEGWIVPMDKGKQKWGGKRHLPGQLQFAGDSLENSQSNKYYGCTFFHSVITSCLAMCSYWTLNQYYSLKHWEINRDYVHWPLTVYHPKNPGGTGQNKWWIIKPFIPCTVKPSILLTKSWLSILMQTLQSYSTSNPGSGHTKL